VGKRLVARAQPALEQSLSAQFKSLLYACAREQMLHDVGPPDEPPLLGGLHPSASRCVAGRHSEAAELS